MSSKTYVFKDKLSINQFDRLFLYARRRRVVLCRALRLSGRPSVRPLTFRVRSITLIPFKIFSLNLYKYKTSLHDVQRTRINTPPIVCGPSNWNWQICRWSIPSRDNSYTMVCPSVREDNARALASELSPVQADKLRYDFYSTLISIDLAQYEVFRG